jgi:hypothetical protein
MNEFLLRLWKGVINSSGNCSSQVLRVMGKFFGMRVSLFEIIAEPACYLIGRVFVGIFSLGQWKCDPMAEGRYLRVTRSLSYKSEEGHRRFTSEGASMVGMGVVIGSVIVGLVALCLYVR